VAQNDVKIVFTVDDSAVAASTKRIAEGFKEFERVDAGKGLDGKFQKAADDVTKTGKAAHEAGEGFNKLGEHTKKAHEGFEAFGKVGERVKEQFNEVKTGVLSMGLSLVGVAGAWEMIKHAFEEGQAFLAARGRFKNLLGDTEEAREAFERLEKVADETGLHIGDIARGAEGLYAAGEGVDGLAGQMENLAKISVITGTDLGELTELLDRMKTHGDVSFRELFRLTQATGGATRELAMQYRDLPKILEATTKAFDASAHMEAQATKVAEEHRDALEGVAKKAGLAELVFKDFNKTLEATGGRGLAKWSFVDLLDTTKFGPWGQKAAHELWDSFNAGIEQISHESGISVQSVIAMVRSGLYSMDELLSAAKQRRQAIAEQAQAGLEASKAMIASGLQQQQYEILDKIVAKLNDGTAIQEKFTRSMEGWGSKVRLIGHEVEKAFEGIGVSWMGSLKPALDALAKGDVFAAFQKLPGWIQAGTEALAAFKIAQWAIAAGEAVETLIGWFKALQGAEVAAAAAGAGGGAAAAAGGAATGAGGAAAVGGGVAAGSIVLPAAAIAGFALTAKGDVGADVRGEALKTQQEKEIDEYNRKYRPELYARMQAAQAEGPTIAPERAKPGEAIPSQFQGPPGAFEPWRGIGRTSAEQQQLLGAVPTGFTKEIQQYFTAYAKAVADQREAFKEHDVKALQAAQMEMTQVEALGDYLTKGGLIPADQLDAFAQTTNLFSRAAVMLDESIPEAAKDIKDAAGTLAPGTEKLQPQAVGGGGGGGGGGGADAQRTAIQGRADVASAQARAAGAEQAAYAKWFYARGPEAKEAEVAYRGTVAQGQGEVKAAQIQAAAQNQIAQLAGIAPKIDVSNQHLSAIKDTIGKALTASGAA
jgi:hypothetical protein